MFDLLETPPQSLVDSPPPDLVAPEDLVDELAGLFVGRDRAEARIVRLIRKTGETGAFGRDGYSSLSALLKHRMSLHPGEAQRLVSRANGLAHTPLVGAAYDTGAISGAQADVLLEARGTAPDAFPGAEAELVALAQMTPLVRDLRKQLDYWLDQVATDDLASQRDQVTDLHSLTLRREGDMIRVTGWYTIESGEFLRATLEPGPPADGDTRSTPARRADQLIDILNGASDRPNVLVHVNAATLTDSGPGISETSHGTFLTRDEIKRITCDSDLTRVILDPQSQPLDVGRTRRLITPALRAAVCARDIRCVFPNCDRDSHWCDAHHLHHWADGGETKLDNLVLLCRHHHRLIHEGGWTISGTPGNLTFHRPDGTKLGEDPPPRPWPILKHDLRTADTEKLDIFEMHKRLPRVRGP